MKLDLDTGNRVRWDENWIDFLDRQSWRNWIDSVAEPLDIYPST